MNNNKKSSRPLNVYILLHISGRQDSVMDSDFFSIRGRKKVLFFWA